MKTSTAAPRTPRRLAGGGASPANALAALNKKLEPLLCPTPSPLYHRFRGDQLADGEASTFRQHWIGELSKKGRAALVDWMNTGTYVGLWAEPDEQGWMKDFGPPTAIKLKDGYRFAEHQHNLLGDAASQQELNKLFEEWKSAGRPGARKVPGSKATLEALGERLRTNHLPDALEFYEAMKIAGVSNLYGDYHILLNPGAVASVTFPTSATDTVTPKL